ncbi:MAG: helix-turn-helix domain-containing protein [Dehalococcoidia bacterium]|nr:helix-turn-helix domain-containing protein [Dehalococcoidia bacterium]
MTRARPRPARLRLPATSSTWGDLILAAEARILQDALARAGGDVSAAAKSLGISRRTITYKVAQHGLLDYVRALREAAPAPAEGAQPRAHLPRNSVRT